LIKDDGIVHSLNKYREIEGIKVENVDQGADFSKYEKDFAAIGVALKEDATTLTPLGDVLDQVAAKWDTLNSVQKDVLATDAAGVRQKNIFISTMDSYQKILAVTSDNENSQGIAMQKNEIFTNSLQGAMNRLTTTMQSLYQSTINTDFMKAAVIDFTMFLGIIEKVVSVFGGLPTIIGLATTALAIFGGEGIQSGLMNILGGLKLYNTEMYDATAITAMATAEEMTFVNASTGLAMKVPIINSLRAAWTSVTSSIASAVAAEGGSIGIISILKAAYVGLASSIDAVKLATIAFQAVETVGLSLIITGIITVITELISKFTQAKQSEEEFFNSLENSTKTATQTITQGKQLLDTYQQLSTQTSLSSDNHAKLTQTVQQLGQTFPGVVSGFDSEGNAVKINTVLVQQQIDANQKLIDTNNQLMQQKFQTTGTSDTKQLADDVNKATVATESYNSAREKALEIQARMKANNTRAGASQLLDYINKMTGATKDQADATADAAKMTQQLTSEMNAAYASDERFNDLGSSGLSALINTVVSNTPAFTAAGMSMSDAMNAIGNSNALQYVKDYEAQIKSYNANIITFTQLQYNAAKQADNFYAILSKAGVPKAEILALENVLFTLPPEIDKSTQSAAALTIAESNLTSVMKSARSAISDCQTALDQYNKSGTFNIDTILKIAETQPQILADLGNEAKLRNDLKGIIDDQVTKVKTAYIAMIESSNDFYKNNVLINQNLVDELNTKYGVDLKNFTSIQEAKAVVASGVIQKLGTMWAAFFNSQTLSVDTDALSKAMAEEKTLNDKIAYNHEAATSADAKRVVALHQNIVDTEKMADAVAPIIKDFSKFTSGAFDPSKLILDSKSTSTGSSPTQSTIASSETTTQLDVIKSQVDAINADQSLLNKNSQQYRDNLTQINTLLAQEQSIYHQGADAQRAIQSTTKENSKEWLAAQKAINDYGVQWNQTQVSINKNLSDISDSKLNLIKDQYDAINKSLDTQLSKTKEASSQGPVLDQLITATKNYQTELTSLQQGLDTTSDAYKNLDTEIQTAGDNLQKYTEQLANNVISLYKSVYTEEQKAQTASVDAQLKTEETRHSTVMANLENEQKQYDLTISQEISDLDRQTQAQDYADSLKQEETDAQDIQNQINALSLDSSASAKAQKLDLEKKLSADTTKIQKDQRTRNADLIKQGLTDSKDAYDSNISAQKDAETIQNNNTKQSLSDQKQAYQNYYQGLIDDQNNWDSITQDLLSGNISNVITKLEGLKTSVQSIMASMGQSVTNDFINKIDTTIGAVSGTGTSTGTGSSNTLSSGGKQAIAVIPRDSYSVTASGVGYMNSQQLAAKLGTSATWDSAKSMVVIGGKEFPYVTDVNGVSTVGIRQVVEALGHTVTGDSQGNLDIYDQGGIVGGGVPQGLSSLVSSLFGVDNNHRLVQAQVGELMISPSNISSFGNNLATLVKGIANSIVNTVNHNNSISVNINGANSSPDQIWDKFLTESHKLGIQLSR